MNIPDAFQLDDDICPDTDIQVGYMHASILGVHRPDVAYPHRKVRPAKKSYCAIYTNPCPCPDNHVEVWVRAVQ